MRVLALTVGDPLVASTQYRLGQFVVPLEALGISLELRPAHSFREWSRLPEFDLVVVQKRLMRISWVKRVRKQSKRLIFDTDDAIWEPHGRKHSWWTRSRTNARLKAVALAADGCTVPNEYLADHLRKLGAKVAWVPMALDPEVWHPPLRRGGKEFVRIGWAGAPPNLVYLQKLEPALRRVLRERPDARLAVYCGTRPSWSSELAFEYHPFTPGSEADVVRIFDIGLLPLPDDVFAAGKSPIKALQYAACGIPCIATPVGATREIVKHGETGLCARTEAEWVGYLLHLIDDASLRRRLGGDALRLFQDHHTSHQAARRLAACWHSAVRGEMETVS